MAIELAKSKKKKKRIGKVFYAMTRNDHKTIQFLPTRLVSLVRTHKIPPTNRSPELLPELVG